MNAKHTKLPTTARLTTKTAEALAKIAATKPNTPLTIILEEVMQEAADLPARISPDEERQAALIYRYMMDEVTSLTTRTKNGELGAAEKALAARVTAIAIRRIFLTAKGRIQLSK